MSTDRLESQDALRHKEDALHHQQSQARVQQDSVEVQKSEDVQPEIPKVGSRDAPGG